ncbi:MAG: hypothetical protein ACW981_12720 [Candidatus Hodarchaeales archaeon]|jgi:hypothetical protein
MSFNRIFNWFKDMFLLNLNQDGEVNWNMTIGQEFKPDEPFGITAFVDEQNSESIFIYGFTESFGADNWCDLFLAKLGKESESVSQNTTTPTSSISIISVFITLVVVSIQVEKRKS